MYFRLVFDGDGGHLDVDARIRRRQTEPRLLERIVGILHVRDLVMPADVTLLTDLEEAVVRVQAPRQEEVAPVVEAVGEPPAEGAEAAPVGEPAES